MTLLFLNIPKRLQSAAVLRIPLEQVGVQGWMTSGLGVVSTELG